MSSRLRGIRRFLAVLGVMASGVACGSASVVDEPDAQAESPAPDAAPSRDGGVASSDAGSVSNDGSSPQPDAGGTQPDAAAERADAGPDLPDAGSPSDAGPAQPTADCATSPLRASGPIYFYCDCGAGAAAGCLPGDDDTANAGTDPSRPRRALSGNPGGAFERFRSLPAGGTVALCRGGAWEGVSGVGYANNTNCTAAAPCDFRDYVDSRWATTATARPKITANSSVELFQVTDGGNYRIWNLDVSTSTQGNESMFHVSQAAHDIKVCNVRVSAHVGFNFYAQAPTYASGMEVRHSQIEHCENFGLFGHATGLIVDSNYFLDNGTAGYSSTHAIYIAAIPEQGRREDYVFTNNEIYNTNNALAPFVIHGGAYIEGMLVENNYVHGDIHAWAIAVSNGNSPTDGASELVLRRNRVTTTTGGLVVSMCHECVVEDNIVTGYHTSAQPLIQIAAAAGGSGTDYLDANVTVRNNTVFNGFIAVGTLWDPALNTRGLVVTNNAVWNELSGACITIDPGVLVAANAANWCHSATSNDGLSAGQVFMGAPAQTDKDGSNADFRPVPGGPLAGTGTDADYSPHGIGSVAWDPADPGASRAPPVDIGAVPAP